MKVIFLDRDGVINRYPGHRKYVTKLKDFHFLPGAIEAIKRLSDAGFKIFVISNQAGVAKGIYSQKKLGHITRSMLKEIRSSGAKIGGVFYCMHRQEDNCSCRKPKTGLIKKALKVCSAKKSSLKNAFFVGDSIMDVETGRNAGLSTILVLSGRERLVNSKNWLRKPNYVAKDLSGAVMIILKNS